MIKITGNYALPDGTDPVKYGVKVCFEMAKAAKQINETLESIGICLNETPALFDRACNYTDIMHLFLPVEVFNSDEWWDDILDIEDFDVYWRKYFEEENK